MLIALADVLYCCYGNNLDDEFRAFHCVSLTCCCLFLFFFLSRLLKWGPRGSIRYTKLLTATSCGTKRYEWGKMRRDSSEYKLEYLQCVCVCEFLNELMDDVSGSLFWEIPEYVIRIWHGSKTRLCHGINLIWYATRTAYSLIPHNIKYCNKDKIFF